MMHRKIFLSLFFIPIIILGIYLAFWQYQRSIWKEDLLSTYHEKLSQSPALLPILVVRLMGDKSSIIGHNADLFKPLELTPIKVTGHFVTDLIFYRPTHDGIELVTAFETDDGIIAVNAGVMPPMGKDLPISDILPRKEITLNGFYRIPQIYGDKLPDNKALVANIPFASFYDMYSEKTLAGAIQVDDTTKISDYLKGRKAEYFVKNIPNNHTQYMGTWLLLTAVASIIYSVLLRKKA
jgi:cytochrome oxidase assembly protein ShyY1